jgi:hypothetical protein
MFWAAAYGKNADPKQAFPGRGQMKSDDAEVAQLRAPQRAALLLRWLSSPSSALPSGIVWDFAGF